MKLVYRFSKVLNKKTNKPYKNYYVVLDNGKLIQINCAFEQDYVRLSAVAEKLD